VGIAPLRFIAKIASDMKKPDGLTIVEPDEVESFINELPVGKVPGVGSVTKKQLALLGIETLGDIKTFPDELIFKKLGKFGRRLKELSSGIDTVAVSPDTVTKSVSTETTLEIEPNNKSELKQHLLRQCEDIGAQLRKLDATAQVVVLKLKFSDFKTITRQVKLDAPTCFSGEVYRQACDLLQKNTPNRPVRLIGVGVSQLSFSSNNVQLELFQTKDAKEKQWDSVFESVDAIAGKFGKKMVKKGTLMD